jgi:tetratricopeptide (TPR) repeat protein
MTVTLNRAIALLTLVTLLVQCTTHNAARKKRGDEEEARELQELRRKGNTLLRASQYGQAIAIYQSGYERALKSRSPRSAVRFLNNLGSAYYHLYRYRDAIETYLKARDLAISQGNQEMQGALCNNLSSLYFDMGETDAALESAQQGLRLPEHATAKFKASLLLQSARIRVKQGAYEQAVGLLRSAIEVSRAQLDMASEAQAWNELGNTFIELGQLQSGERSLLEAFRLRKLSHDERIYYSYESLGHLRMLQGDLLSAKTLLDMAVESARTVNPSAIWTTYYERGQLELTQGLQRAAFDDFGKALECVRNWRTEVLPADAFRVSSEVELHQTYSSYIDVGGRLYDQTHDKLFAEQTFAASEESRSASLRALWAGADLTNRLPAPYWETLAELFKAEAALVKREATADEALDRRLRLKLAEMEALAGIDLPLNADKFDSAEGGLIERTRRMLRPTEVFLGFHLGEAGGRLWVISREAFECLRLPPNAYFAKNVRLFANAVREDSPEAAVLGKRLFKDLFGGGNSRFLEKRDWIIAPDGPLFDMPFAALVEGSNPGSDRQSYVVERHSIQVVPGVFALSQTTNSEANGPVVGLGDPIYNRADPRLPRQATAPSRMELGHGSSTSGVARTELARLAGSGREIESCARIWRSEGIEPVLLTGASANKKSLSDVLKQNPAVLHMAAHILFPERQSGLGFIALALQREGEIDLLSATEVASFRAKLGLVVLNGCSSAHAAILPGAGLMGMTRAWLAAGARAVVATRWALPDRNEGDIFATFYERLRTLGDSQDRPSFAQVLQQAQLSEMKAGGWRAKPAYWAAYLCVERK